MCCRQCLCLFCLCGVLIFRCQLVWKVGMGIWRRILHREEHMGNGWKPKILFPLLWFLTHGAYRRSFISLRHGLPGMMAIQISNY